MSDESQKSVEQLEQLAEVRESTQDGSRLTRWIRAKWLNVAARWYVQEIFAQQNQFNRVLVKEVAVKDDRLNEQERDLSSLLSQADELAEVVTQLRARVADLEQQVALQDNQAESEA